MFSWVCVTIIAAAYLGCALWVTRNIGKWLLILISGADHKSVVTAHQAVDAKNLPSEDVLVIFAGVDIAGQLTDVSVKWCDHVGKIWRSGNIKYVVVVGGPASEQSRFYAAKHMQQLLLERAVPENLVICIEATAGFFHQPDQLQQQIAKHWPGKNLRLLQGVIIR